MRKSLLAIVLILGICCIWLTFRNKKSYAQNITTYFQSAPGLKAGALVCADGVEIGKVTDVRVLPNMGDHPIKVSMRIKTPYELKIPSDATASLSSEGVLGPTFVDVDTRNAHGPSLGNNGRLKSLDIRESKSFDSVVGAIGNALIQASQKDKASAVPVGHSGP